MKKYAFILATLASLGMASLAHAGWDKTTWGMSQDKVSRIYNIYKIGPWRGVMSPKSLRDKILYTRHWESVEFSFSQILKSSDGDNGLQYVFMETHDNYGDVKNNFIKLFGSPVYEHRCEDGLCIDNAYFIDRVGKNNVLIVSNYDSTKSESNQITVKFSPYCPDLPRKPGSPRIRADIRACVGLKDSGDASGAANPAPPRPRVEAR